MKLRMAELSRRGVFRTLVAYAIASWVLIEVSDVIGGAFLLPEWFVAALTTVLVLGAFPVVILSWRYDITWEGVKRDTSRVTDEVETSARRISAFLLVFLVAVTAALWVNYFRSQAASELDELVAAQQGAPEIGEDGSIVRVAVLPFDDFSPEGGKQWVADSIADAILHRLSQNRELIVTAKTSSFGFRDSGKTAAEIGKALGVQALLEGSVQVIGDRLKVTSQFIRTSDQAHIWSDVREATTEDWFELQDSIARAITELVLPHSKPRSERADRSKPPSLEAYRLLMVGRDLIGFNETNDEAVKLISVVTEIWPDYADAWAWLSEALTKQARLMDQSDVASNSEIDEVIEERDRAVETALELDPENMIALLRKSRSEMNQPGKSFHEAIERVVGMAPNDPDVLNWLAELMNYSGDYERAAEYASRGRAVDPADNEILVTYMIAVCGRDPLESVVERQLADYPASRLETLSLMGLAAFCDADYPSALRLGIEQSRIDRDPATSLENLFFLASLGDVNALRQMGAAQRVMRGRFDAEIPLFPRPAYFTSILPERLNNWRRSMDAGFGDGSAYAVALVLSGEYEQAENLIDRGIRMWEGFYQGMDTFWHFDTMWVFAFKAWLLANRGEEDQAAELANELLQALRDRELTRWADSFGKGGDVPLMILVLNGETQQALDWLAGAEQSGWLGFQALLTSPVYAEFRQVPDAAATLERMSAWRAGVLEQVLALGLPEVEDPGLLVDYMESLVRPTHHELAQIALHFDNNPVGALEHYERALTEEPDNVRVIGQAAELAIEFGFVDEAVRVYERAVSLAPNDPEMHGNLSIAYGHAQRWQDAVAGWQRAAELAPDMSAASRWLGQMLLLDDRPDEAEEVFLGIEGEFHRTMGLIMAYHALGREDESDALLAEWLESSKLQASMLMVAYVYAFRGENDEAFEWLEKAAASPHEVRDAATFPMLLNLHDDPRWLPFLESIGKAPEQLAGIEFSVNLPRR